MTRLPALPALTLALACAAPSATAVIDFNKDIRPLLSKKCFSCHGPDSHTREGGLRLDRADGEDGAHAGAIVPGDVEGSELWHRVLGADADEVMPPPDANIEPVTAEERALLKEWIAGGAEYEAFWAFVPPRPAAPPEVADPRWAAQPIDRFVAARLAEEGLAPKPESDKRTLIRRVSFDLTGLPPSTGEIAEFLADGSPDAYMKLVDRLLAKPQYGEHMAKYWLDLVRFADTNGMHHDHYRDMTPYRDWVIRAFNDNMPYDTFVVDQIAGDLHPRPSQDQLIASGFNRLHLIIDVGTALPEESFFKNVVDRVSSVGTAFMGLTMQCAVCHDHKYDPITMADFYQLSAFFNNFDGGPETGRRGTPDFKRGLQPPYIELGDGRAAMVMKERAEPRPAYLHERGAYDKPGAEVARDTPAFLPPLRKGGEVATRMDLAGWMVARDHPLTARVAVNRFWQQLFGTGIVRTAEDFGAQGEHPSHPQLLDHLALRFVDSGWDVKALMREIVTSETYRQSSKAPRAEYEGDPANRLLARGSRFRLDSEMVRDGVLAATGLLNPEMYGKSVKPPQPEGLWKIVAMPSSFPREFQPDSGDAIYRRSVYTFWKRGLPPPQMTIFDAPERTACIARRERTNTPLQALLLMNEEQYFAAARHLATRLLELDDGERLASAYEAVTSHLPDAETAAALREGLDGFRERYAGDAELTRDLVGDAGPELAEWTMLVHSLLNLDSTKTRE